MWHKAALIGAVFALLTWIAICLVAQPARIEEGLSREAEIVLKDAALEDLQATVAGRDVTLEGEVESPAVYARAERLVAGVAGIRTVDNRLTVREKTEAPAPIYLEIRLEAGGVSLRGTVPSEELRLAVEESARQTFSRVDERLTVDATVPNGAAVAAAAGVVRALAGAGDGVRVRLQGDSLRLSGTVASAEERRRVEDSARAATSGVRLFFSALSVEEG